MNERIFVLLCCKLLLISEVKLEFHYKEDQKCTLVKLDWIWKKEFMHAREQTNVLHSKGLPFGKDLTYVL